MTTTLCIAVFRKKARQSWEFQISVLEMGWFGEAYQGCPDTVRLSSAFAVTPRHKQRARMKNTGQTIQLDN